MIHDMWWAPIRQITSADQLSLVKVRARKTMWYLVTNLPIHTEEEAWKIVFAYRRRWQIELSFRSGKSELGMESPRLWSWENRLKLLGIVTLVYAFLLFLLNPLSKNVVSQMFQMTCHRTGKRYRDVIVPLYRVRWALSRLWNDHRPVLGSVFPPNMETIRVLALKAW